MLRDKKYILSFGLLLLSSLLMAEVVVLQSNQTIRGEVVLQNEDVVIIRSRNGMRYQYPMNEVLEIKLDDNEGKEAMNQTDTESHTKSVAVRALVTGGTGYSQNLGWGGHIGADMMIGANILEEKRIFVGGEVGYRAMLFDDQKYSFIPLQACFSAIWNTGQHSPIMGVNIGYGISANRKTQGGICAGANVGWHYKLDHDTSITLGVSAEWQQAQTDVKQTIDNPDIGEQTDYINHMGVNFLTLAARLAIHF